MGSTDKSKRIFVNQRPSKMREGKMAFIIGGIVSIGSVWTTLRCSFSKGEDRVTYLTAIRTLRKTLVALV